MFKFVENNNYTTTNNDGGSANVVSDMKRLRRFLILGTVGGTYYVSEKELTADNVEVVKAIVNSKGIEAVDEIVKVSVEGLAAKQDPTLFAYAVACAADDINVRKYALSKLQDVCRTATHLFGFLEYVTKLRGWGSALKKAVQSWYQDKSPKDLSYQVAKYQQREGWSHRDVLRLTKPVPVTEQHDQIYAWATGKALTGPYFISAMLEAKMFKGSKLLQHIAKHKLTREMLPTEHLRNPNVLTALLPHMGLTAILRNLANMDEQGLFTPMSEELDFVRDTFANKDKLRKARIHPYNVLLAINAFDARSDNRLVLDILEKAFYESFQNVEATGKRRMLAVDVSDSMTWPTSKNKDGLAARDIAACMAMVALRSEPNAAIFAFSTTLQPMLNISATSSLMEVKRAMANTKMGGTNISAPMVYARKRSLVVDTFEIFTDNETNANTDPLEELKRYRRGVNKEAKLIVYTIAPTGYTVTYGNDSGNCLDVVGFDASAPSVANQFILGKL